jgi:hypothetical protein
VNPHALLVSKIEFVPHAQRKSKHYAKIVENHSNTHVELNLNARIHVKPLYHVDMIVKDVVEIAK